MMMATYNGEKYVAEQIDSILAQQDVDVTLQISDDGSTDGTCAICEEFAARRTNVHFRKNAQNKGLAKNFMDILYEADAAQFDYFAFSDQDDCWMPEKLSVAIAAIKGNGDGPQLYYSDVCNVDESLQGGHSEYDVFAPFASSFELLLLVNWASGCTMVFNSQLAELLKAYEPPEWPRIHDGWIHLVALSCGHTVPDLKNAYIKRRIAGHNQVGERGIGSLSLKRIRSIFGYLASGSTHYGSKAARCLLEGYSEVMPEEKKKIVIDFLNCTDSFSGRMRLAFDPRYRYPSKTENIMHIGRALFDRY